MTEIKTIDKLFYKELGNQIRYYRSNKDLSQRELSRLLGVSRGMVDNWELGRCKLKPFQFKILCNALGINSNFIVNILLNEK